MLETQGRLRALLSATRAVSEDLSLPLVLDRIVESACRLTGAQSGSIGLLDAADQPTTPAAMAVPIRVRDQVFGHIYLTEKTGGRAFTDDDRELLVALAGTAAIAIEHAQLYAAAQAQHRALTAAAELSRLLTDSDGNPLAAVAQLARRVGEADLAAVVATDVAGRQRVAGADGKDAAAVRGMVVRDTEPAGVAADLRSHGAAVTAAISVPFTDGAGAAALLLLARQSEAAFGDAEREAVELFAGHVSSVLAQLAARHSAQLVRLLQQRDAIAQELNDSVVSRLFAAGLTLQGIADRLTDPDARLQVMTEVDDIDAVITTIRNTIFTADPGRLP